MLDGADKKDLMRKLPKFIYDEDKALEVKHISIISLKIHTWNTAVIWLSFSC